MKNFLAFIDFETTGLTPGLDRVVEISVFKMEPGKSLCLAFDTLVNPLRPMAATEIHGISNAGVADAPTFNESGRGRCSRGGSVRESKSTLDLAISAHWLASTRLAS